MNAMHSLTLSALCETLKRDLAKHKMKKVAASCGVVKTKADITPQEWEGLGDSNRDLLKHVCGYSGP